MSWNIEESTPNVEEIDEVYRGLREQAFNITPADLHITLDVGEKYQVYAAVIDMPVNNAISTLVCMFDGTTSLYFSNGGAILGAGQKHETVAKATREFLFSSGQAVPFMQKMTEYPLPTTKEATVYLKCGEGVFSAQINMEEKLTEIHKEFLDFLIQRVLNALRDSNEL